MEKRALVFNTVLFIACLLVLSMVYVLNNLQSKLQQTIQQIQTTKNQVRPAVAYRQEARKKWAAYNHAELCVIAAKLCPTLYLADPQGKRLPPLRGVTPAGKLRIIAAVEDGVEEHLPQQFRYEVTKCRASLYRYGELLAQETREDNKVDCADMKPRRFDMVMCEALEVFRIDKEGKRTPIKPRNPIFWFNFDADAR